MEEAEHFGWRPDEDEAVVLADLGEVGVLREEAVAGMDRLGAGEERGGHDRGDVHVRLARVRRSDADRLVGEMHREAMRVGFAVHGHRLDAELPARADDPHGDLATVRDEHLLDGCHDRETCASQKRLPSGSAARATRMPY